MTQDTPVSAETLRAKAERLLKEIEDHKHGRVTMYHTARLLLTAEKALRDLVQEHTALVTALKAVTADMDRAGGDGYGMSECPWCRRQDGLPKDEIHNSDCELLLAREAIALAEGRR